MPKKLNKWITPQEASLEASIRAGHYVAPDDIKQLRLKGKIPPAYVQQASGQIWLYDRDYIISGDATPKKRVQTPITVEHLISWLNYPQTLAALQREGFEIPHLGTAQKIKEERKAKYVNPGGRKPEKKEAA